MPSIAILNAEGDVRLSWNPESPEEVKHAQEHFDRLKQAGHIFFRVTADGGKGKKLDRFEATEVELICEFDPKADLVAAPVPRAG